MRPRTILLPLVLLFLFGTTATYSQSSTFDLEAYRQFLATSQSLTPSGLQAIHPAGEFTASVPPPGAMIQYLNAITSTYGLTSFELAQLEKHGFVVTSRRWAPTFEGALHTIYHADLPVFVSTDAILQTIHESYDNILKEMEKTRLINDLQSLLTGMRGQFPTLETKYGQIPGMAEKLRDVDLYCTVPLRLLDQRSEPYFSDNAAAFTQILGYISALQPQVIPLFSSAGRTYDFSQFTVRGHYTTDTALARYFRAMMWLGRTELYLLSPQGTTIGVPFADLQRQMIDAALITECVRDGGVLPRVATIDELLRFLVGESDNVTIDSLQALFSQAGVSDPSFLLDSLRCLDVQNLLRTKTYAGQRIISQILMTNPRDTTLAAPASAFLLLGQRFVIDSYITGNVVYDKIRYNGEIVPRMLPSSLDVLFALGNNAAGQLLAPEMETYHYAPNAAAMRRLVDSYPEEFWTSSLFNAWLGILRTLNPPATRNTLPPFMQTAAWWQEKMNTQLASWAQLRHDNILYAKQSYTPAVICSYPQSYVEPIPLFFEAVKKYAELGAGKFGAMGETWEQAYFLRVAGVVDTLKGIAEKELSGTPFSDAECIFLRRMLVISTECGAPTTGWYPGLRYGRMPENYYVIADVHTAPTDAAGAPVGWVLHAGTGPVDVAVVCADLPGFGPMAFVGPVMSYYEHLATNFKRLTDEEWKTLYAVAPSLRPSFVNLYLASDQGTSRGDGPSLVTGIAPPVDPALPAVVTLFANYPNPFNPSTAIPFTVAGGATEVRVTLEIFNIRGQLISRLLDTHLPRGNYTVWWDGRNAKGAPVASGSYVYRLRAAGITQSRSMMLVR